MGLLSRLSLLIILLPLPTVIAARNPDVIPQCRDITLTASYLAEEKVGEGPGFLLRIENHRDTSVAVADPTPLSVHWYALNSGRWLWRASSGAGGSLLNAFSPGGPVFVDRPTPGSAVSPGLHVIAAKGSYTWSVFTGSDPALRYRPGCEHCTYAGEQTFRAVLAYAYIPSGRDRSTPLLSCGLRSTPVVMPPLTNAYGHHNSATQ